MSYRRRKGKSIVGGNKKKKDYSFKGIPYKSSLEKAMGILLDSEGIDFEYEPVKIQVMQGFDFPFKCFERQSNGKGDMVDRGNKKVLGISYTPDFVGEDFIIETKGYANETFPLRWKMFKKWLTENGHDPEKFVIYKPQKVKECEEVVKLIKQYRDERKREERD